VRAALEGDPEAFEWMVQRFTPVLFAQALERGAGGRLGIDPEELVQEVWSRAVPRILYLDVTNRRATPTVVAFLSSTLKNACLEQARRRLREGRYLEQAAGEAGLPGVVERVCTREAQAILLDALEHLAPVERRILVLRAIEQMPAAEVAEAVGLSVEATHKRYQRALAHLRKRLPGSVFDDL
jgi:RNA polymerase sigma factor (sigma-70 family)